MQALALDMAEQVFEVGQKLHEVAQIVGLELLGLAVGRVDAP